MKIFYNGSTGSLGQYLGAALIKFGIQGQALHSRLEDAAALTHELSLSEPGISANAPVILLQMAALVSVTACEENPDQAFKTNVTDTLETVKIFVHWARQSNATPIVVYVSTGHVYKTLSKRIPVTEDQELAPRSVYAKTKLEAETLLKELAEQLGLSVLVGRVFGLIAPRQPPHYVLPGLIRRVQSERLANIPGLEYYRDYLDSRDVCDALVQLCTLAVPKADNPRVVNICSGKGVSIRRLMEEIIFAVKPQRHQEMLSNLSPGPGRPDDVPWLVGSSKRLEEMTGRKLQQISLTQTIRDALSEGIQQSQQQ
ncbi:MAG: NAD(P)-dependent oxidoreductase [Acidobacteria bacterium]|nr:NAD(P)-dependent oxidoreductase [Acidobacteriota bacterium]